MKRILIALFLVLSLVVCLPACDITVEENPEFAKFNQMFATDFENYTISMCTISASNSMINNEFVVTTENGERIQIALSLTCPKVQVAVSDAPVAGDFNFEDDAPSTVVAASAYQPADITDEERSRVNDLMKKLGL